MLSKSDVATLLQEVANDFGQNLGDSAIDSWQRALDENLTLAQAMQAVANLAKNPSNGIYRLEPSDINAEIRREKHSHDSTRAQIDDWLDQRRVGVVLDADWVSHRVELYKAIYGELEHGVSIPDACIHSVRRVFPQADISVEPGITFQQWAAKRRAEGKQVSPMLEAAFGVQEQTKPREESRW